MALKLMCLQCILFVPTLWRIVVPTSNGSCAYIKSGWFCACNQEIIEVIMSRINKRPINYLDTKLL